MNEKKQEPVIDAKPKDIEKVKIGAKVAKSRDRQVEGRS